MSAEPTEGMSRPNPRYASDPQVHYDAVLYVLLSGGDLIGVDDERRRKNIEARYLDRGPKAAVEFLYSLATFAFSAYANGVAEIIGTKPNSRETIAATIHSLMSMVDGFVEKNALPQELPHE